MKFFIDTANVNEIRAANDMGVIAGVTTNPSLIAKEGRDYAETLAEIATIVDGARLAGRRMSLCSSRYGTICCLPKA